MQSDILIFNRFKFSTTLTPRRVRLMERIGLRKFNFSEETIFLEKLFGGQYPYSHLFMTQ